MNHMNLSDELRAQLIESAAWGKAGITPRLDEEETSLQKKIRLRKEGKRVTLAAAEEAHEKGGGSLKSDKPPKSNKPTREDESTQYAHACPLCASELSEAIEEERLLEHLNIVVGLVDRLSQLQEGDEDIDTVIDETIAELLLQNEEE